MTSLVLANNAQSTIAASLAVGATQLQVASGQGARFPNPGANQWFPLTLIKADGSNCEIVRATARSGDQIEIVREQEGTTAVALVPGDIVVHQMTAEAFLALASTSTSEPLETSSGTGSAYALALPQITSLTNNLAFEFIPHLSNLASATLKIGNLPAKPLRKRALNSTNNLVALTPNEILQNRQAIVHYDISNDVFVVSNPNFAGGSATGFGLARRASDPQTFDENGDDNDYVTQRTSSQIAQEAIDVYDDLRADGVLPYIWRDLGNSAGGSLMVPTNSSVALAADLHHQYDEVDIPASATLTLSNRGVCVIRCDGKFTLNGRLVMPMGQWRIPRVIGPTGSVISTHSQFWNEINNFPSLLPGQRQINESEAATTPITSPGRRATARMFEAAMLNGSSMEMFQGGNGGTYRQNAESRNKGGLIVIAEEIEIGPTAIIDNMNPEIEDSFASGNPIVGQSGGGVLTLVSEMITVDPQALFEAAAPSDPAVGAGTNNHRTSSQLATDSDFLDHAANGQMFQVNRLTAVVSSIF